MTVTAGAQDQRSTVQWWAQVVAHLAFTRINIELTILCKKIEDFALPGRVARPGVMLSPIDRLVEQGECHDTRCRSQRSTPASQCVESREAGCVCLRRLRECTHSPRASIDGASPRLDRRNPRSHRTIEVAAARDAPMASGLPLRRARCLPRSPRTAPCTAHRARASAFRFPSLRSDASRSLSCWRPPA